MIEKPLGFCPVTLNLVLALVRLSEGQQPGEGLSHRLSIAPPRDGAARQVQAHNQSQNRKAHQGYDSAVCSLPSRQGNQMTGHSKVQNLYKYRKAKIATMGIGGKETNGENIVDKKHR
jgi:hypothetical protein